MKTNNNVTPQTKYHGHAQDTNKTTIKRKKSPKYQKHKFDKKRHHSIPMLPHASKGKLNLSLL